MFVCDVEDLAGEWLFVYLRMWWGSDPWLSLVGGIARVTSGTTHFHYTCIHWDFFSLSVSHNVLNQIPFKYFLHIITKLGRYRPLTFQAKYCRFSEAHKLPGTLSRTDDILLYMLRSHSDGVCRSRWWCRYRSVKGSPLTQWEPLLLSTAGEKSSLSLNSTSPSFLPLASRSH